MDAIYLAKRLQGAYERFVRADEEMAKAFSQFIAERTEIQRIAAAGELTGDIEGAAILVTRIGQKQHSALEAAINRHGE